MGLFLTNTTTWFGSGSNRMAPMFPSFPLPTLAHAGGQLEPVLLKEELWIAIQPGQGPLTSFFFALKVSTHIQKEHDRTVCLQQTGDNFRENVTECPLKSLPLPQLHF